MQLANGLWNTLDCANRQTSLNLAQAEREPDGSIRIVLAHRDPGAANWLDTIGHRTGALTLRFTRAGAKPPARTEPTLAATQDDWMSGWDTAAPRRPAGPAYPAPTTRVAKLAEVAATWPAERQISAENRRAAIGRRIDQITRMLGEPPASPKRKAEL